MNGRIVTAVGNPDDFVADSGETVAIVDVVDGCHLDCIPAMQALHARAFPEHPFAREAIGEDGRAPSVRPDLIVHQWLVTVDDQPAGILLFDSNRIRRVAPLHFVAVDEQFRDVRLGGVRLGDWAMTRMLDTVVADGADLGSVAETPASTLKIFLRTGWCEIGDGYLEPIHGWDWPTLGLETRPLALAWRAPPTVDPSITTDIAQRAAAAFLLDMYGLSIDIDWVAELTGLHGRVVGPRRH